MPLSWNEIRHRAIAFSKEWTGEKSERAEKQTFWNEFFDVFGVRRMTPIRRWPLAPRKVVHTEVKRRFPKMVESK